MPRQNNNALNQENIREVLVPRLWIGQQEGGELRAEAPVARPPRENREFQPEVWGELHKIIQEIITLRLRVDRLEEEVTQGVK
jgi:hypothetical protein